MREALGRWIIRATWAYVALVLVILVLMRWVGEAWWGVAVLLFVPRWIYLGPVAVLAMASGLIRRPSPWAGQWAVQGAVALAVAGPLMEFNIPFGRLAGPRIDGERVRILSFNVGQLPLDGAGLVRMIERERIDLICFQERMIDPHVEAFFARRGWRRDASGKIVSRFPIVAELAPLSLEWGGEDRCTAILSRVRVRAPTGSEFIVASVHLPTIRWGFYRLRAGDVAGLKMHLDWWRLQMERVAAALGETRGTPLIVAGDFNMPSDGSTMAALRSSFRFAFDEAGFGYGYTRPSRYPWFRIDHILASPEWGIARCWVGPDFGSDHLPLLAEFALPPTARRGGGAGRRAGRRPERSGGGGMPVARAPRQGYCLGTIPRKRSIGDRITRVHDHGLDDIEGADHLGRRHQPADPREPLGPVRHPGTA